MHVKINTATLVDHEVPISNEAADAVNLSFNPSGRAAVDEIKALSAALISAVRAVQRSPVPTLAGREANVAITHLETAQMWAVKAATRGG